MHPTLDEKKNLCPLLSSLIRLLRDSQHTRVPELEGNYAYRILTRLEDILPKKDKKIQSTKIKKLTFEMTFI
jgi:hypothetical protein